MPEPIPAAPGTPYAHEIGSVEDLDGTLLTIRVDYGAVSIGPWRLGGPSLDQFAKLFIAATWQAEFDRARMHWKGVAGARDA